MGIYYKSPLGILKIDTNQTKIKRISIVKKILIPVEKNHQIKALLDSYFKGRKVNFKLAIDLSGLSSFQKKVLLAVRKIPYGKTISYKELAIRIKNPKAVRAVGQALKKNPLPIIIPCHRVLRADKSLGGFNLGLKAKKYL
ncbi:MAG: methylated-DNA--[protein]-cysteine S-methyltransferase, partial [candidate division WOR-3 bacterium]|nr:methylated-DNA--[protein]-cysteine S-methyltransferase [candidate division WOR-3 bacterium]